jgi:hypothetical protein
MIWNMGGARSVLMDDAVSIISAGGDGLVHALR